MDESTRVRLLEPVDGPVDAVLDTDTYNEIDDQFALAWMLVRSDRIRAQAVYAAPFHNDRSAGPGDGMERSYEEILRVMDRLGRAGAVPVFRGSTDWMTGAGPQASDAASDLVDRAMARDPNGPPLYVLTIGAPTNVASALANRPELIERIVVVWLGGQPHSWPSAREFNLQQDPAASRVLFDSGVPLVQIPCTNVSEHLRTTHAELRQHLKGSSAVGDYLCEICEGYWPDTPGRSKVIWDISAVAWLLDPSAIRTRLTTSPILTDEIAYSLDMGRHLIREAVHVQRDAVYSNMFSDLAGCP